MPTHVKHFVFSPFQENTYVLYDESKDCVIIDPGCYGSNEENELKDFIQSEGLNPVMLLNTHSHLDHIFGNAFVSRYWGLTPQVHPLDKPVYESFEMTTKAYGIPIKDLPPEPEYTLQEGNDVLFGKTQLKVHFLPGHCPGHVAFECVEDNFIIAGDVIFQRSIGRTDLPGGDHETLISSIKNKLMKLDLDRVVHCGHGPSTTLREEEKHNPFLQ